VSLSNEPFGIFKMASNTCKSLYLKFKRSETDLITKRHFLGPPSAEGLNLTLSAIAGCPSSLR
jgi:hypothetical protein